NPYYDNGIKFFASTGLKLEDDIEFAIEKQMQQPMTCVASDRLGKASRVNDAAGRYIEYCKGTFPSELSLNGLRIVVDCAHGATYHIAPNVLRELGATVYEVGTSPDGLNINKRVGATSIRACIDAVKENNADLGFALDGDGDRIMMVDEQGNVIDGDQIIYIIARDALRAGTLKGGVVGTKMTNLAMELALGQLGVPFERANVGDRYVVELLQKNQWMIGGENSGHVLNLQYATTGDGIVAGLQVISAMLRAQASLSTLANGYHKFPQKLLNIKYSQDVSNPIENEVVKSAVETAEKAMADDGRVLLRKSGTEPLIRVMVEAKEEAQAEKWATHIAECVEDVVECQ
ncbi:MAG: phosphoglucosamine mutase, partial [Pseudomonadota bacterium]